MAEIADMMLDGVLCACSGAYLGDASGYIRRCEGCEDPHDTLVEVTEKHKPGKHACPLCYREKKFYAEQLRQHLVDRHRVHRGRAEGVLRRLLDDYDGGHGHLDGGHDE